MYKINPIYVYRHVATLYAGSMRYLITMCVNFTPCDNNKCIECDLSLSTPVSITVFCFRMPSPNIGWSLQPYSTETASRARAYQLSRRVSWTLRLLARTLAEMPHYRIRYLPLYNLYDNLPSGLISELDRKFGALVWTCERLYWALLNYWFCPVVANRSGQHE